MSEQESSKGTPAFHTTRWTMVMRARGTAPEARAALGELCEAYWMPVYRFLMREGRSEDCDDCRSCERQLEIPAIR